MRKEQIFCDECGASKGEGNHWRQMGVVLDARIMRRTLQVVLGSVIASEVTEIHDLCGDQCFHKHIDKLLAAAVPTSQQAATSTTVLEEFPAAKWEE